MNNGLVLSEVNKLNPIAAQAVRQNVQLVDQLSREIRTISHLLHPPLLDEVGLLPAIRSFCGGICRNGATYSVEVDLSPDIGRLAPKVEISIFRIVQECLTNIYRHSGSKTARIRIWPTGENLLTVQVCDEGKGIRPEDSASRAEGFNLGTGMSGMRERVLELGGKLEVQSGNGGTTIVAAFPLVDPVAIGVGCSNR